MTDEAQRLTLEERRLALEERKWESDDAIRKLELDIKARESGWTTRLVSPLTATLFAGILTIAGSVTATLLQGASTLQLETKKFVSSKELETQKQQHELILKMLSVGDVEQANRNVRYLAETGLIDPDLARKVLAAKESPVLPRPSGPPNPGAQQQPIVEIPRRMSADSVNLLIAHEVGSRDVYEKTLQRPVWSAGQSGLIIGIGYDLGYETEGDFRTDWKPHIPAADVERPVSAIGIRGAAAEPLAKNLSDIAIRWEAALAVFNGRTLPKWTARLELILPNSTELPPDSFGALVSLAYNRGPSFTNAGDRFTEMRAIRDLIERRQFPAIPDQFRSMKRLWPNMKGLQERREAEAKLFEKGLNPTDRTRVSGADGGPAPNPSP